MAERKKAEKPVVIVTVGPPWMDTFGELTKHYRPQATVGDYRIVIPSGKIGKWAYLCRGTSRATLWTLEREDALCFRSAESAGRTIDAIRKHTPSVQPVIDGPDGVVTTEKSNDDGERGDVGAAEAPQAVGGQVDVRDPT
jgi:hypothetical protein